MPTVQLRVAISLSVGTAEAPARVPVQALRAHAAGHPEERNLQQRTSSPGARTLPCAAASHQQHLSGAGMGIGARLLRITSREAAAVPAVGTVLAAIPCQIYLPRAAAPLRQ